MKVSSSREELISQICKKLNINNDPCNVRFTKQQLKELFIKVDHMVRINEQFREKHKTQEGVEH